MFKSFLVGCCCAAVPLAPAAVRAAAVPILVEPDEATSVVVKLRSSAKLYEIPVPTGLSVAGYQAELSHNGTIEFAEPNYQYRSAAVPNDPNYSVEWYNDTVGAPAAWDTETGSRAAVIAVLDTGVDVNNPDLVANIWHNTDDVAGNGIDDDGNGYIDDYTGWDFVSGTNDPLPKFDANWTTSGIHHGTAVAGVAGAVGNNGQGIAGTAWQVSIMPIRVLDRAGVGDTRNVYQGIRYAVQNGAHFINLSFVGNTVDPLLTAGIEEAWQAGVVVFAAAGNDNVNLNTDPRYPVCNDHVVGVGGVDRSDVRWTSTSGATVTGSNYSSTCIDIVAPASGFLSTSFYDQAHSLTSYYTAGWSGTSLATPMVTAAAALLKSHEPTATAQQIITRLLDAAQPIDAVNPTLAGQLGRGRLAIGTIFSTPVVPVDQRSIVTAPVSAGGPQVRTFGSTGAVLSQYFAYATTFRGGVRVASGSILENNTTGIVTSVSQGGAPHVRVFDRAGVVKSQFYAYATTFRGGVNVAVGDVDGDGVAEIVTGTVSGAPHIRVFNRSGTVESQFFAYATTFRGGAIVAVGEVDGDGVAEIVTCPVTGAPHVRVFDR
ncbi:MAG: S8 family serine peptidase, partial [Patescibacteria group bacterium]